MTSSSATSQLPRLAAIDLGTNTIRLVVVEVERDGTYRVLDEEREMTRLGRGLFRNGRIARTPMEQSLNALCKMRQIADGFGVQALKVAATSAVREAVNGGLFRREAQRRCGIRIDVVSPEEEARLAFKSVTRHLQLGQGAFAAVDIGGGSTEVVLAADGVVNQVYSLPLGAVRLTEKYCRSDPLRRRDWKRLKRAIDRKIADVLGDPPFAAEVMVGTGGTFTNLGEMMQYEREGRVTQVRGYELTRGDVVRVLVRLRETPLAERRHLPALNPKRADIIVAGAAVVVRLAKYLDTRRVLISDRGVRDGLIVAMIEELGLAGSRTPPTAADRMVSVREFAHKCRSNQRHCEHVAALAVQLFEQLSEPFEIAARGRDVLEAAALLHDVGYLVNHAKHHKHAYHLIMHGDLRGFSPGEVELIANIARYHRRAFPRKRHENFAQLDSADRLLVRQLSGILRVADGFDRTHGGVVKAVRAKVNNGVVRIRVSANGDPAVDIADAKRKGELFESAFETRLAVVWEDSPGRKSARAKRRLAARGNNGEKTA